MGLLIRYVITGVRYFVGLYHFHCSAAHHFRCPALGVANCWVSEFLCGFGGATGTGQDEAGKQRHWLIYFGIEKALCICGKFAGGELLKGTLGG